MRVLLEKLMVAIPFQKLLPFTASEASLQCSQEPYTGPYPQPQLLALFFRIHLSIILPPTLLLPRGIQLHEQITNSMQ
jgi:hypothetical protein